MYSRDHIEFEVAIEEVVVEVVAERVDAVGCASQDRVTGRRPEMGIPTTRHQCCRVPASERVS